MSQDDATSAPEEFDLVGAAIMSPELAASIPLHPDDFYSGRMGALWAAIGSLHASGHPIDPIRLVDEAAKLGAAIPHDLVIECVGRGFVGDAEYYAEKIREGARRRRMKQALVKAMQRTEGGDPLEEIIANIGTGLNIASPLEREVEKAMTLEEFVGQRLPPTEWVIPGLLTKGDRLVLTGTEGAGKALALDTPIPTPTGWTTMGDLEVGDQVMGADGRPTTVVYATEVQHGRTCYRVTFSDGATVVADADHRWLTSTLKAREASAKLRKRSEDTKPRGTDQRWKMAKPEVVTTEQIKDTLWARAGHCLNHAIPTAQPLELPDAGLPIDPYLLGAWLGDGSSHAAQITTHTDDGEILDSIRSAGYTVEPVPSAGPYQWSITRREQRAQAKERIKADVAAGMSTRAAEARHGIGRRKFAKAPILSFSEELRVAGLLQNKHIPSQYLRAGVGQRVALLQGLMDTDGTISASGSTCEFCVCNKTLAEGMVELLVGLGMKPSIRESVAKLHGVEVNRRWRVTFVPTINPFHLQRKRDRYREPRTARGQLRYITAVEPVESVPVRCIQVDNPDHLYLCGKEMIPTHNTQLMRSIGIAVSAGRHPFTLDEVEPRRVLYIDCENPLSIMVKTMASMAGKIRGQGVDFGERMWIKRFPQGIDLASASDRLMLHTLCRTFSPDILMLGPVYKLAQSQGMRNDEDIARCVTMTLDGLREEFGFALILEHHSPHGQNGVERSVRPIGSSLWLRWPEFGYGLRLVDRGDDLRHAELIPWRGARDQRDWPKELVQGGLAWADARMPGY